MKTTHSIATLALLALLAAAAPAHTAATPRPVSTEDVESAALAGSWKGALAVQSVRLRLVFHVTVSDDGKLAATLDSPDQGAEGIPVESVTLDDDSIRFDVSAIGAVYEGTLDAELSRIDGDWRQSGQVLPLVVERGREEE